MSIKGRRGRKEKKNKIKDQKNLLQKREKNYLTQVKALGLRLFSFLDFGFRFTSHMNTYKQLNTTI